MMCSCKGDGDKKTFDIHLHNFSWNKSKFSAQLASRRELEEKMNLIILWQIYSRKRLWNICVQNIKQVNCLYRSCIWHCAVRREIRLRFKVFDFRCIRDALFTLHINFRLSGCRALGCTSGYTMRTRGLHFSRN